MAYVITKTDGTTLVTVADGTVNNSTDLTLIGKNYFNYGSPQNQNFVKLLENFSNTSAPSSPITGQLWYDKTSTVAKLKVYDGSRFKEVGGPYVAVSEPTAYWKQGDFWLKTSTGQLYLKSQGTTGAPAARLIGPLADPGLGKNGFEHTTDLDAQPSPASHEIISMYTGNTRVAAFSEDTFSPAITNPTLSDFPNIRAGLNLSATSNLYVPNTNGIYLGASSQGQVRTATGTLILATTTNSGTILLEAKSSTGSAIRVITVKGEGLTTTTGYVGINNQVPTTALDVNGIIQTNSGFVSTDNTGLQIGDTDTAAISISAGNSNLIIANNTSGASVVLSPTSGNVLLGGDVNPASGTNGLVFFNGTTLANVVNACSIYAISGTLRARNAAGGEVTITPHAFDLIPEGPSEPKAWAYYSIEPDGSRINVDMLRAIRLLEKLTGEKLVYTADA